MNIHFSFESLPKQENGKYKLRYIYTFRVILIEKVCQKGLNDEIKN